MADLGHIFKEADGFLHRHIEHFINVFALITHLQRLSVIAFALANLAGDVDVRQKVHFDFNEPVTGAGLAAAAADVEGKPA